MLIYILLLMSCQIQKPKIEDRTDDKQTEDTFISEEYDEVQVHEEVFDIFTKFAQDSNLDEDEIAKIKAAVDHLYPDNNYTEKELKAGFSANFYGWQFLYDSMYAEEGSCDLKKLVEEDADLRDIFKIIVATLRPDEIHRNISFNLTSPESLINSLVHSKSLVDTGYSVDEEYLTGNQGAKTINFAKYFDDSELLDYLEKTVSLEDLGLTPAYIIKHDPFIKDIEAKLKNGKRVTIGAKEFTEVSEIYEYDESTDRYEIASGALGLIRKSEMFKKRVKSLLLSKGDIDFSSNPFKDRYKVKAIPKSQMSIPLFLIGYYGGKYEDLNDYVDIAFSTNNQDSKNTIFLGIASMVRHCDNGLEERLGEELPVLVNQLLDHLEDEVEKERVLLILDKDIKYRLIKALSNDVRIKVFSQIKEVDANLFTNAEMAEINKVIFGKLFSEAGNETPSSGWEVSVINKRIDMRVVQKMKDWFHSNIINGYDWANLLTKVVRNDASVQSIKEVVSGFNLAYPYIMKPAAQALYILYREGIISLKK